MAPPHHLLVGTFDTSAIFTLAFDPVLLTLSVVSKSAATGPHSWLNLSADHTRLYATAWTTVPGLAAYALSASSPPEITLINQVETASRSGYCCSSPLAVYSAGGASGEVFRIDQETGGFAEKIQDLAFVDQRGQVDDGGVMDFGGLRHGAHSADLSLNGKMLYVADLGRNCIFVYQVNEDGSLELTEKNIATREEDAPRHVTPHPNGRYVYSLQEHTSMVDVFELIDNKRLAWRQGVKIIPAELSRKLFWADEVRLSPSGLYLFASTRGLVPSQNGYVTAFSLLPSGLLASEEPLDLWRTPTSGGWANAIEPAPATVSAEGARGEEWIALTDSEEGLVMVLGWDGKRFREVARTTLKGGAGAATAVWLTL